MITERDQLLNMVYDLRNVVHLSMPERCEIADALYKLIKDRPDWTPCAEGLPTKTADYKVTVQVGSEMGTWRETKIIPYRIVDGVGEWILPKSDWLIYGVIAWTKADEPWTGGLDGK